MALTWPASSVLEAGPTGVQTSLDTGSLGLRVKIWKLTVASSLPCSPSPLVGSGFWKVSDQPFKVPVVPGRAVRDRQRPGPLDVHACWPPVVGAKTVASDSWGL